MNDLSTLSRCTDGWRIYALHALAAFVSYVSVTALLFHAIVRAPSALLPSDPGDPVLNTWHTARPQRPGDALEIELDRVRPVGAVVLALGPYGYDFPRRLLTRACHRGKT